MLFRLKAISSWFDVGVQCGKEWH